MSEGEVGEVTVLWSEGQSLLPDSLTDVSDDAGRSGAVVPVGDQSTLKENKRQFPQVTITWANVTKLLKFMLKLVC